MILRFCPHVNTIRKLVDGLFLDCCREAAKEYPDIEYEEAIIDTAMLQMASKPEKFDVMVMPNLYGDIASDLAAGLIGGLGLTPSGNIGTDASVFEAVRLHHKRGWQHQCGRQHQWR